MTTPDQIRKLAGDVFDLLAGEQKLKNAVIDAARQYTRLTRSKGGPSEPTMRHAVDMRQAENKLFAAVDELEAEWERIKAAQP